MKVNKALIIADPWIGFILGGTKDWEMRSSASSHRGWFGLIRKGTGAVYGVARLVDVGGPLSPAEMIATHQHHRIPDHMICSGEVAKWNVPWKLAEVHQLDRPVPYRHKSGAVTWVELDDVAVKGLADAVSGLIAFGGASVGHVGAANLAANGTRPGVGAAEAPGGLAPARSRRSTASAPPKSKPRCIGEIEINEANFRNSHFYMRPLIDLFPADVIGGSNKASAARREVSIDWGGPEPARTDIDGEDKKFFRARSWIGAFYKLNLAQARDLVVIEETGSYHYRVSLKKARSGR